MGRLALIVLAAAASALALAASSGAAHCTVTFDGPANGSWHTAANWSGDALPVATDHVCVSTGFSVIVSQSVTVEALTVSGSLTLTGGTLTLTSLSDASSLASFTMTGGTLAGDARVNLTGTGLWSGGTMQGAGTTAVASGATLTHDDYTYLDAGRRLEVGGVLNLIADRGIYRFGATGLVHVLPGGLVRKSGSAGEAWIDTFVENDGVVDATAGSLKLTFGGGAEAATGSFGTDGQAGKVRLTGGTFPFATGAHLRASTEIAGGTAEVLAGHTAITSGTGNAMTAGYIAGPGTFELGGAFAWSGGTMRDAGTTRIPTGATATHDDYAYLQDGRALEVAGTLDFVADRGIYRFGTTGLVHVLPGGLVRKSGSAGEAWIDTFVENDGVVDATSGSIKLTFGGGAEAATGRFGSDGQTGGVRFTGGTFALGDGAELSAGAEIAAGTVEVLDGATATVAAAGAEMTGGTVSGGGTFEIAAPFLWSGGTMAGAGVTRIAAAGVVTHDDYSYLDAGRTLEVAGVLSFVADRGIYRYGTTGRVHVLTGGHVRKSGSTGDAWIDTFVENDGVIDAIAGNLKLTFGGGADSSAGDFGAEGQAGRVRFTGGTFAMADGAEWRGGVELAAGTVEVAAGTLSVSGSGNAMTGGSLAGAGTVQLAGAFAWSGGEMTGAGTTVVGAGATTSIDDYVYLENGRTLQVAGTVDLIADRGIYRTAPAEPVVHVVAGGLIRKSAGAGRGWIDPELRNHGTVQSTSGELALTRGAATAGTGAFTGASETARVSFESGTHLLGGGTDLAGWVEVDGATVQVPEGVTVAADEHLVLSSGTLGGAGTLSVPGELLWRGGRQQGPGTTAVPAAGDIVVEGCGGDLMDGRVLDNAGTLRLVEGGQLDTYSPSRPTILNSGRIELDDSTASGCFGEPGISGNALLSNTGTIEKLGSTGYGYVDVTLDNDGTALASSGELRLSSTSAVTHNGSFESTGGGTLAFDQGTFVLGAAAGAAGTLLLRATLEPGAPLAIPAGSLLRIDGGTLQGTGDVTVSGSLEFLDGQLEGAGALILEAGSVFGGANHYVSISGDRQVVNRGTMTLAGGTMALSQGASLLNAGTLAITGNAELYGYGFGWAVDSVVHNAGTIVNSGSAQSEISAALDNDGTVEVAGGSLHLSAPIDYSQSGDALTGGEYLVRAGSILRVPGPVRALGARLLLDGAGSSVTYQESFNTPVQDALGLLARVTGAGSFELAGGRDFTASGPLLNAGAVRLGAGSELSATGLYRQTGGLTRLGGDGARVAGAGDRVQIEGGRIAGRGAAAPVLDLDGGGAVSVRLASGSVDEIAVPGEARLDGTLVVETDSAFSPSPGSEITVMTYGSRVGEFDAVEGLAPRPGLTYALQYRSTSLVLVVGGSRDASPSGEPAAPEAVSAPAVALAPLRLDDRSLLRRGAWSLVSRGGRTLSVATADGAALRARGVRGRSLTLVAETCRRCGAVRVHWRGRLLRRISLKASTRRIRRFVIEGTGPSTTIGAVELRASGRVAIDALIVRR